jgi:hypothetical protein
VAILYFGRVELDFRFQNFERNFDFNFETALDPINYAIGSVRAAEAILDK